jgi:cobalt/nickel transport system permease protein
MIHIDKLAYGSKLRKTDPLQKFFFTVLTMSVCIWANSALISMAILVLMIWVTTRRGGTPLPIMLKLLLLPMSFLFLSVLAIAVNASENPALFLFSLPIAGIRLGVTQAGMQTAVLLFFKALGTVSCLYYLSLSTPMVDILAGLSKLKVPKLMLDLMGLTYRFIFVLLETAETIFIAQQTRLGYATISSGYRSLGGLASSLLFQAYRRFDHIYTALEVRGYEGEFNMVDLSYEKNWAGYIEAIFINSVLIMASLWLSKAGLK